MTEQDYAGKAHAVQTSWGDISPNSKPAPTTQAIFDALTFSPEHTDLTPQAPNGHHPQVVDVGNSQYQTLYFTRELSESEKRSVDELFETLRREHSS